MSGQRHTSDSTCPTCGHDEGIVRVRGNAFSVVCVGCGRADVTPLLSADDLLMTEGETLDAELFELDAVRSGQATPLMQLRAAELTVQSINAELQRVADEIVESTPPYLRVDLRMPVPPR